MAAPILDLVLPAMSEASANLIGQRLRQRMSHLHPHIESTVSFVPEKGRCKAPRIKPSWSELVLVPINATHLHSSPPQLTRHAEDIRRNHPDLAIRVARPTGPAPALLNLVDARLRLAAHRVHAQELDALILSTPDSGDQRGAAMLSKMTRLWSQHHHLPVHIATNSGGTTNVALYEKGTLRGVCCLDIGGRLIKVDKGSITYIFPKIQALAKAHGIDIQVGERADEAKLGRVCALMAGQLAQALHLKGADGAHQGLYTNGGKPLPERPAVAAITFSGGVADCVYQDQPGDVFRYGDIGVLLGRAIRADAELQRVEFYQAAETIRATVVGAGTHATDVSGSTIRYDRDLLPIKNIPILKVSEEDEASLETLKTSIIDQLPLYMPEGGVEQIAIAFTGEKRTSFADIQALAAAILESTKEVIKSKYPLVVVVENDIGKVLGNALNVMLEHKKAVICIDGIHAASGDYIDIGEPIAGGQVLPVVIKTLIFNS